MKNAEGKLLTKDEDILKEALNHYSKIFKDIPMKKEHVEYWNKREQLCMKHLEVCKRNKTPDWTIQDVTFALKCFKTGKSQDPYEIPNEIFRPDVAGSLLINATIILLNRI